MKKKRELKKNLQWKKQETIYREKILKTKIQKKKFHLLLLTIEVKKQIKKFFFTQLFSKKKKIFDYDSKENRKKGKIIFNSSLWM